MLLLSDKKKSKEADTLERAQEDATKGKSGWWPVSKHLFFRQGAFKKPINYKPTVPKNSLAKVTVTLKKPSNQQSLTSFFEKK